MKQFLIRYRRTTATAEAWNEDIKRFIAQIETDLEDFSAKVTKRLDDLDRSNMQDIIRNLVRRIEIDESHIEVIFRVPSPDGPSRPSPTDESGSWQHCTGVGRTHHSLAQPLLPSRQGLGKSQLQWPRVLETRLHPPHAAKAPQSLIEF
jgi:hypothetical protein